MIEAAAEKANWGASMPENCGRRIAYARYKNSAAYCAVVVEAFVDEKEGIIEAGSHSSMPKLAASTTSSSAHSALGRYMVSQRYIGFLSRLATGDVVSFRWGGD